MMWRPDYDPDEICNYNSGGVIKSVIAGTLHQQINRISKTFPCNHENGGDLGLSRYDMKSAILVLITVQELQRNSTRRK